MNAALRPTAPEAGAAPQPPPPPLPARIHWPSVWQLALSALGLLGLWVSAAVMLLTAGSALFSGDTLGVQGILLTAAGLGFSGVLLIPSMGYALMRLLGKPVSLRVAVSPLRWSILSLPLVILLGYLASQSAAGQYLFLPVFHILAALIPVVWLLAIGLRGLPTGSQQRAWGVFSAGLVGAPFLSLLLEVALLLVFAVLGGVYLAQNPEIRAFFQEVVNSPVAPDPEAFISLLEPYLVRPEVFYLLLVFSALQIPLIEEAIKPIGVWLLAGRGISAAEGFAAGLLSGAGYALFENLILSAGGGGGDWALTAAARTGTSLVHILTTGLMGWALALAWREQRYLRLMGVYLLAILIHGAWNALVILTAVSQFTLNEMSLPNFFIFLGNSAPFGVVALLILGVLLYLMSNAALRASLGSLTEKETTNDGISDYPA